MPKSSSKENIKNNLKNDNSTQRESFQINASPTKEFFIDVLKRDISLKDAISELIDNCVDGASRQKNIQNKSDYSGFEIRVRFDENSFIIEDNCGGIPVDIAQNYAFRFGRSKNTPLTEFSIGKFGVGMKRALFKIGEFYSIESRSENSSFTMEVDIEKWKSLADDKGRDRWEFDFKTRKEEEKNNLKDCGTKIFVSRLLPEIANEFAFESFKNSLIDSVESQQLDNLERGLSITINGISLTHRPIRLLMSNVFQPIRIVEVIEEKNSCVKVEIFAGVDREPKLQDAGWYVFCNNRLILKADKTPVTGWGIQDPEKERPSSTPRSHYQYSMFRGYVFFSSEDPGLLPWNTMKTGVDIQSPLYKQVLQKMTNAQKQVISFLNKLDKEKDNKGQELQQMLAATRPVSLSELESSPKLIFPKTNQKTPPEMRIIKYFKPIRDVEKAMRLLKTKDVQVVGEKTFEYYLEMEDDGDV